MTLFFSNSISEFASGCEIYPYKTDRPTRHEGARTIVNAKSARIRFGVTVPYNDGGLDQYKSSVYYKQWRNEGFQRPGARVNDCSPF